MPGKLCAGSHVQFSVLPENTYTAYDIALADAGKSYACIVTLIVPPVFAPPPLTPVKNDALPVLPSKLAFEFLPSRVKQPDVLDGAPGVFTIPDAKTRIAFVVEVGVIDTANELAVGVVLFTSKVFPFTANTVCTVSPGRFIPGVAIRNEVGFAS